MDHTTNAQTVGRDILDNLDRQFARLHLRSLAIIQHTAADSLYSCGPAQIGATRAIGPSVGESLLRAAAVIEQTFGGITSNLWDDPFEWTLPEFLTTPGKVLDHLDEVEATRRRAFDSFTDDSCLTKQVATPTQNQEPLVKLLLNTLTRATYLQSQAAHTLQTLSGISADGFII